jgi:hypothetical protein
VFIWSPKSSISWVSAQFQMPQVTTVHRILWKSLCQKRYKLQVIQKRAASNTQLRSQLWDIPRNLGHDNFLSCIAFTGKAKFLISGCVSQHNCVILAGEPPREHLEHEREQVICAEIWKSNRPAFHWWGHHYKYSRTRIRSPHIRSFPL